MSEIKRGDLVMVVAPRQCGCIGNIGIIATVGEDDSRPGPLHCVSCGAGYEQRGRAVYLLGRGSTIEVVRLRRIDPPATGEYDGVPVRKTEPHKELA